VGEDQIEVQFETLTHAERECFEQIECGDFTDEIGAFSLEIGGSKRGDDFHLLEGLQTSCFDKPSCVVGSTLELLLDRRFLDDLHLLSEVLLGFLGHESSQLGDCVAYGLANHLRINCGREFKEVLNSSHELLGRSFLKIGGEGSQEKASLVLGIQRDCTLD